MPRRASTFTSKSASTPNKSPAASSLPTTTTDTPTRQSARLKSSPLPVTTAKIKNSSAKKIPAANGSTQKTTPKKSQYFSNTDGSSSEVESDFEKEESGYEDEDASASGISSPPESANESESPEPSSDDSAPKKKRKRGPSASKSNKRVEVKTNEGGVVVGSKGQELWRPGVKSKLAPGEAVFVPLPKARGDGGIKYEEGRVHPNTMLFLGDLRANNDREWLKVHDADYRQSKKDFDAFVENLTPSIIEKDETIPELPPKDLTFRIYRDIRFSSDPTPYKTHFSAAWSRTGRKGPYAGYYLQIAPSRSFLGAGLWHPEAAPLALLRRDIDRRPQRLKGALKTDGIVSEFFGLKGGKKGKGKMKEDDLEKECVKKFVGMNQENALKTKPRDYDADHRDIALLRLRNFTIGQQLKDEEVVGKGGLERVVELMGCLVPFVTYLNSVVMPDEPGSSSSSEAEDNAEADEGSASDIEEDA
ncbi:MAG: hypothetical protein Q9191_007233 [Dirinaria sp. TL-2023a]